MVLASCLLRARLFLTLGPESLIEGRCVAEVKKPTRRALGVKINPPNPNPWVSLIFGVALTIVLLGIRRKTSYRRYQRENETVISIL